MIPLILASTSPRRRQLLEQIGLPFRIVAAGVPEAPSRGRHPIAGVMGVANRKAAEVARRQSVGLILGADTVVLLGGELLGKPAGPQEAYTMLAKLQGRRHEVITGVALRDAATGKCLLGYEVTEVQMRALTPEVMVNYVATGEPLDKAGAYGIQGRGALLIERIEGCYYNVVGLPLVRVAAMLEYFGYDPWSDKERDENEPGI